MLRTVGGSFCARRETIDMTKGPRDIPTEWIVVAQKWHKLLPALGLSGIFEKNCAWPSRSPLALPLPRSPPWCPAPTCPTAIGRLSAKAPMPDIDTATPDGRTEVDCSMFHAPGTAILFILGQSNAGNYGQSRYTPTGEVYNSRAQRPLLQAQDPLLGATGNEGSPWDSGRRDDRPWPGPARTARADRGRRHQHPGVR